MPSKLSVRTLLMEALRCGTLAALAMMPFGLLFRVLDLRVGYYGPKFAALFVAEPTRAVLFVQHLVLGWISALPLLAVLPFLAHRAPPAAIGAVYGLAYYVAVNSLALPLYFGDPTPWQLGVQFVYPSLAVHLVFGVVVALAARRSVTPAASG